ncbi:hypothetical protein P780_07675 [Vibrio mimicus CAIM 1882]|nr:hypothetical protein P780_07675 [Vibrio mimicus CAIM 1882]
MTIIIILVVCCKRENRTMADQERGVAAFSLHTTEWQGVTMTDSAAKRIIQLSLMAKSSN